MSTPVSCAPTCCETALPTQLVGPEGPQGDPGTNGTDGVNAFSFTTADFTVPAIGDNVTVFVTSSAWASIGQNVFVEDAGTFSVSSKPASTSIVLTYLNYAGNTNAGNSVSAGAEVSPAGTQVDVSGITELTNNTGGTVSNTLVSTVGIQTLTFYMEAASIANGDLMTNYVPGYAFKILKFDARCAKVVSTGAKLSNINLEIETTNLTGGVIALAGTYALGAAQAGTAITAANTGSATDSFSIEAANTTAFIEGAFVFIVSIQNMDTVDALASLAGKQNELLTALAP